MKKIYFFLIAFLVSLTMNAGEVTEQQALQKAKQFMKGKQFKQTNLRRAASTAGNPYYVFNAENKSGFVIVAGDDRMPDILGYAEKGNFNTTKAPDNVKWLMGYYAKVAKSLKESNKSGDTRRAPVNRAEVQPLIKTMWDQGDPYNMHCPKIGESHALTGCVATAMSQVIYFHQWPLEDVKAVMGYTTGKNVEVTALPTKKFNWYNMTDDDIAWLMRYCGQTVFMEYKDFESGAAPSNIPYALSSYFGYSKNTRIVLHESYSDSEWEEMIYNEVNLGRPVIYSGFQEGGSGHSFVVHGYRDGKFYVNWGWSGDCDGYFTLTNLAPNEYMNFSNDQNAVIGIQPASADVIVEKGVKTIDVKKAGTLSDYISESEKYKIKDLTLTGELNGTDIRLIREMMGCGMGADFKGQLYYLDLSGVRIVEGGDSYYDTYFTIDNTIGDYMFSNSWTLISIILPKSVETIKKEAFNSSGNLKKIAIPKSVTQMEMPIFSGCNQLLSITIEEENPVYTTMGNSNAIIERATNKLIAACPVTSIPEGVTTIATDAFPSYYWQLGAFKLPESLTTIEERAFPSYIEAFVIPRNVNSVNPMAFSSCNPYSIVVDPANSVYDSRNNCNAIIETATNKLVAGCSASEIPEGILTIGTNAFNGSKITKVAIPNSVTTIEDGAFESVWDLRVVKVSRQNPIEISEYAFWNFSSEAQLIVPNGSKAKYESAVGWNNFKKIVEESEYGSNRLTLNVSPAGNLPNLIAEKDKFSIEELVLTGELNGTDLNFLHAMAGYDDVTSWWTEGKLRYLDISKTTIVTGGEPIASKENTLGEEAFKQCYLEEVILPNTLTSIGDLAFSDCNNIKSIVIPKSVVELGHDIFYNTPLNSISVEKGNPVFDSRDNCNAVIETATNTLIIGCPQTVIPNTVTTIGATAFSGKPGLTSVDLPDGITTIEWAAFWANAAMTSVHISKTIVNFGESPFGGCSKISSFTIDKENPVYDSRNNCNAIIETATNTLIQGFSSTTIPDDITAIAPSAFAHQDHLTSIEIPASVTCIGKDAFYGCSSLTTIISHIKKPYSSLNTFNGGPIATLYVPYGTKNVYTSTPGWDVFENIVEMEPDDSYQNNSASIAIPDFGKHYAAKKGKVEVPISITSEGIEPITSIDYTITTGSQTKEYHLEISPISYMMTSEVLIPFDADDMANEEVKTLKITKVNGVANECTENISATGILVTVAKKPKIIPVVEEYTGTWCGWCVKGTVGLKLLNKEFGKDVITIAIHDGTDNEPMMLPEYRSVSGTYPSCQINRGEMMDPYYGTGQSAFGIRKKVEAVQRDYALGGIVVNADWADESQTAINIKTTTTFVEDVAESPYQIGYVLLEDGLTGTGDAWAQSNYYAGSSTSDENLKELTSKPSKITDMKYDHVPVAAWEPMTGVAGTIPTTITRDVPMEYTFKADISSNTRIQNKNNLTVVVLLIDKTTGKIINANKVSMASIIPGDVNGDGLVNVTDIVATVNYIMEKPSDNFNKDAADLNGDGEINVTDIVKMVTIIMSGDGASSRRAAATSSNLIISGSNIQLRNAETYTAAQFDINLSDGESISNVVLNVSSNHDLYWKMIDANTCRVVVYSMTNAAFSVNGDNLFDIFMAGGQSATISNELLIKAGGTTGIDAIRREAENGKVYDLSGRQVKNPRKGLYIINGKKVVVK
ncbi:MAG: leucine-rich repeat protein [Prevotella sp.]|nr:leucine-rich repeat protein [Prevotella sp.]